MAIKRIKRVNNVKEVKEVKEVKNEKKERLMNKAKEEVDKWVEDFSENRGNSYARDIEHNINLWCSIWEDSNKAKAYRKQWNDIYSKMARWWED